MSTPPKAEAKPAHGQEWDGHREVVEFSMAVQMAVHCSPDFLGAQQSLDVEFTQRLLGEVVWGSVLVLKEEPNARLGEVDDPRVVVKLSMSCNVVMDGIFQESVVPMRRHEWKCWLLSLIPMSPESPDKVWSKSHNRNLTSASPIWVDRHPVKFLLLLLFHVSLTFDYASFPTHFFSGGYTS